MWYDLIFNMFNFFPFLPRPINMLLSFDALIIFIGLSWYIIKRILRKNFIRTLVIYPDITQRIADCEIKENKLKVTKDWQPKIPPQSVMPKNISVRDKLKFWGFKQADLVIAVWGAEECVVLRGSIKEEDLTPVKVAQNLRSKIFTIYTKSEVKTWIRKVLNIALSERKLFKDTYFFIFMMVLMFILVLNFLIANRIGVF